MRPQVRELVHFRAEGSLQSGTLLCGSEEPPSCRPSLLHPRARDKGSLYLRLCRLLPLMRSLFFCFFFPSPRSQDVEEPDKSTGSDTERGPLRESRMEKEAAFDKVYF